MSQPSCSAEAEINERETKGIVNLDDLEIVRDGMNDLWHLI